MSGGSFLHTNNMEKGLLYIQDLGPETQTSEAVDPTQLWIS